MQGDLALSGESCFRIENFAEKTTVFDLLGKLIDETEYMSSDIYHEEIRRK